MAFLLIGLRLKSDLRSSFSAFSHEKSFILIGVGSAPEGQVTVIVQRVGGVPDAHVALQCMP